MRDKFIILGVPRPMMHAKAMAAMADATPPPAEAGTSDILVSATGTVQAL